MASAYRTVLAIAARLRSQGYLRSYAGDLVRHDKAARDYHGPFLWSVRETGTHLLRRDELCDIAKSKGGFGFGRNHGSAWRNIVRGYYDSRARSYVCSPRACREITGDTARVTRIMEGWMRGCDAPASRKRDVLAGGRSR